MFSCVGSKGTSACLEFHTRYDPFGRIESESGTLAQDFRFQSKFLDPRSGLSYFGFRWDATGDGRWLTRDPLRERAGLNLYAYVDNDPLNRTDAWGLDGWGRYDEAPGSVGGGVCTPGTGPRPNRPTFKLFIGKLWAGVLGLLGIEATDGSNSGEGSGGGVRGDAGGFTGSDGTPNAVAGVRG